MQASFSLTIQDISSHVWFSSDTSPASHRAASVHRLYSAKASDIKNPLMFLSGSFQTSLLMWAQLMCVYLQSLGAASPACFTMSWKSVSNQFSPLSQSGSADYWQQVLFPTSQIAFMLFQQQTELRWLARNTPALHHHGVQVELGHLSLAAFVKITCSRAS